MTAKTTQILRHRSNKYVKMLDLFKTVLFKIKTVLINYLPQKVPNAVVFASIWYITKYIT